MRVATEATTSGGVVERGVAAVVAEIQQLRTGGPVTKAQHRREQSLIQELLDLLDEKLDSAARLFARGSSTLSTEDLLQVGRVEVVKCLGTFSLQKSNGQTFEQWSYFRVRRAMKDLVQMHGADVHVSDGAARGRTKKAVPQVIDLRSRDIEWQARGRFSAPSHLDEQPGGPSADSTQLVPREAATPEQLLGDAQMTALVRRFAHRLDGPMREVVLDVFGVGRPERSVREIARDQNESRTAINTRLQQALAALRRMLESEG